MLVTLGQVLADSFSEGPQSRYFRLCGRHGLRDSHSTAAIAAIDNNEWVWLFLNITLFTKMGIARPCLKF